MILPRGVEIVRVRPHWWDMDVARARAVNDSSMPDDVVGSSRPLARINGFHGERAVAAALGLNPELIGSTPGPDGGVDLEVDGLGKIDVKCPIWALRSGRGPFPQLLYPGDISRTLRCDWLVLAWSTAPRPEFVFIGGVVKSDRFAAEASLDAKDGLVDGTYSMQWRDLDAWGQWKDQAGLIRNRRILDDNDMVNVTWEGQSVRTP